MKNLVALKKACDAVGGKSRLASSIGVSVPSVYQWHAGTRPLPAERVLSISRATGWKVTPHDLRPDLYPNPTDGLPSDQVEREEA